MKLVEEKKVTTNINLHVISSSYFEPKPLILNYTVEPMLSYIDCRNSGQSHCDIIHRFLKSQCEAQNEWPDSR